TRNSMRQASPPHADREAAARPRRLRRRRAFWHGRFARARFARPGGTHSMARRSVRPATASPPPNWVGSLPCAGREGLADGLFCSLLVHAGSAAALCAFGLAALTAFFLARPSSRYHVQARSKCLTGCASTAAGQPFSR